MANINKDISSLLSQIAESIHIIEIENIGNMVSSTNEPNVRTRMFLSNMLTVFKVSPDALIKFVLAADKDCDVFTIDPTGKYQDFIQCTGLSDAFAQAFPE